MSETPEEAGNRLADEPFASIRAEYGPVVETPAFQHALAAAFRGRRVLCRTLDEFCGRRRAALDAVRDRPVVHDFMRGLDGAEILVDLAPRPR